MNKLHIKGLATKWSVRCCMVMVVGLSACAGVGPRVESATLRGVAAVGGPLAGARILVIDGQGVQRTAVADDQGRYALDVSAMRAPLLISAVEAGENDNCRYNGKLRARCMAAVLVDLHDGDNVANVNPLTDRIVSDVAVAAQFIGPQQLVDSGRVDKVDLHALRQATELMRAGFGDALRIAGVSNIEHFDPVTTPMRADSTGVDAVLRVIHHNRGYDNLTSESGHTTLTDISFRPIVGLEGRGAYEPLDYPRALAERAQIETAPVRVLIVGDSTAATYEQLRMPRMGWGQVFGNRFKTKSGVVVLNGARSGRSSRDFYNGGWFAQMAQYLRPGDYVIINHGHNDQNCDASKPERGAADVAGLCTYPNDAHGKPQFPEGRPDMSFQKSLERYIEYARSHGATPILATPTTRVWNAQRKQGFPVVPNHYTVQNPNQGIAFVGDYARTVRETAAANKVPLVDLEAKTIDFVNAHAATWKDYWLAVGDTQTYPYYKTQSSGTAEHPDTTHFQQKGAQTVADMVVEGIKESPDLRALAAMLK